MTNEEEEEETKFNFGFIKVEVIKESSNVFVFPSPISGLAVIIRQKAHHMKQKRSKKCALSDKATCMSDTVCLHVVTAEACPSASVRWS